MSNRRSVYRYLFAVPKNEILASLREKLGDETLLSKFENVKGHPVTADGLRRATHKDLIQIAEESEEFTPKNALELHEEFRYRGTKTLYIHSYTIEGRKRLGPIPRPDDLTRLNEVVQTAYDEFTQRLAAPRYTDLKLRGADRFGEKKKLWEIVYTYIAEVRTTDPVTEEATPHPDLRYGFIWVNRTEPWIVISARDERIAGVFKQALEELLDISITRLPIPKEAEIAVESYQTVRQATHVDWRGVRKKVTHKTLFAFLDEVKEMQLRDRQQMRSSSGYNIEIDGTSFVVTYSREKGAISLSKLLPTSKLRQFGVEKVSDIYHAVQDLLSLSPEELVPFVVNRVLAGFRGTTKNNLQEILAKLATARRAQLGEIQIGVNPYELARMSKYFILQTEVQCIECSDLQYIRCIRCGAERFRLEEEQLICKECDTVAGPGQVQCASGHEIDLAAAHEVMTLYPTKSLLGTAEQVLMQASQIRFNRHEEGFFLRGTTLHAFGSHGEKTVYLMDDIPEFSEPASLTLSERERSELSAPLRQYKEKCRRMADDTCAKCVQDRVGPHCLMRLYGLYDHRYTPRPHHGGEFGDVSLRVTIDGRKDRTLVILLKKGNPNGKLITKRHSIGRDLYTQIDEFWTKKEVAIIGIAVPQRIQDGFAARLQHEAYRHDKKLVFFGFEELAKIVQFVLDRHGLDPNDL